MEDRRRCTTVRQLELLIEFLESHRDLALGRVRSKEARALATRLWSQCAENLNSEGPARTAKEWSKVWNDYKCKIRTKLVSINASQRGTGGGPSTAPILTALEERVANILGRDVGPLQNVRQEQFAVDNLNQGDGFVEETVEEMVIEDMQDEQNVSQQIILQINEHDLHNTEQPQPSITSPTPSLAGQVTSPTSSQTERNRARMRSRATLRAQRTTARQATVRATQPQNNRAALEESRSMVLNIENMRAEAMLLNARANKSFADGFKLVAESVDRFSQVYSQQHLRTSRNQEN